MGDKVIKPIDKTQRSKIPSFGTDGIRGQAGTVLTAELVLKLGYWCGQTLSEEGPILIGNDSRKSADLMTEALTDGLIAAGKEVWTLGLCPTPAIPGLIKKFQTAGGIMVSASHNPPEDNGIKIFRHDGTKLNQKEQDLINSKIQASYSGEEIRQTQFNTKKKSHHSELLKHYKESLLSSVGNLSLENVPIVLDLCWGSATAFGAEVFRKLGADLTVLHGEPNGDLINVGCGSTNLEPLKKTVIEKKAKMGFAFDGDSDRMMAVDGKGRVIDGDHVLYLWGSALEEKNALPKKMLVATVMSNLGFERAWNAKGGILERTPVGDQYVYSAMLKTGAALGGEQSGHILSTAHGLCGDGVLTALQLATICHSKNLSLEEWLDQSFTAFSQKLVNIPLSQYFHSTEWKECKPLTDGIQDAEHALGNDGRVLIRTSGTEPLLRIMVEASDPRLVNIWSSNLALIASEYMSKDH